MQISENYDFLLNLYFQHFNVVIKVGLIIIKYYI